MANLKKLLLFSQSLFLIPSVFAAEIPAFSDFISNLGDYLWSWTTNSYSVYFFTFIFFFILLYGIYSAALRKVKIFQDGESVNRQGKLIGVSLSLLSCLAIFFFTKERGIDAVLEDVLAPFGIFAGFGIAVLVFSIVYFGFRDASGSKSWKISLAAAGFGMIIAGMITSSPNILSWGFLLAIIAGIASFFGLRGGGTGTGEGSAPTPPKPPEGKVTIYGKVRNKNTQESINGIEVKIGEERDVSSRRLRTLKRHNGMYKITIECTEPRTINVDATDTDTERDCYQDNTFTNEMDINPQQDRVEHNIDMVCKDSTTTGEQPTADGEQPTADGEQPTADGEQPTADVQPTTINEWDCLKKGHKINESGEWKIVNGEGIAVDVVADNVTINGGEMGAVSVEAKNTKIKGNTKIKATWNSYAGIIMGKNGHLEISENPHITGTIGILFPPNSNELKISGGEIIGTSVGVRMFKETIISGGKIKGKRGLHVGKGAIAKITGGEIEGEIISNDINDKAISGGIYYMTDKRVKDDVLGDLYNGDPNGAVWEKGKEQSSPEGGGETPPKKKGWDKLKFWKKKESTKEESKLRAKFDDKCPVKQITQPPFVESKEAMVHFFITKKDEINLDKIGDSLTEMYEAINEFKKEEKFSEVLKKIAISDNKFPERWISNTVGYNHFENQILEGVYTKCHEINDELRKKWHIKQSTIEHLASEIIKAFPEQKGNIGFDGASFIEGAAPEKIFDFKEQLVNQRNYNALEEESTSWYKDWNNFAFGVWEANRLIADLCEIYTGKSELKDKIGKRTKEIPYEILHLEGGKKKGLLQGISNLTKGVFKGELSDYEIEQSKSLAKRVDADPEIKNTLKFIFQNQLGGKTGQQILHDKDMMKHLADDADYLDIAESDAKLIKDIYKKIS